MNQSVSGLNRGKWLMAACLSTVLPIAALPLGVIALCLLRYLSGPLGLHPGSDPAVFPSVGAAGVVLFMQVTSLILGLVSFIGGITMKSFLTMCAAMFGILVSGFFGCVAYFVFGLFYAAMMGEAC
jgi:hypothetical protein